MLARLSCLVSVLLLAVWPALSGDCATIDAQLRAEDPRLETPVTLTVPRIYLGELLERLSAQTGVAVSADKRDEASGMEIAIVVEKQPLGAVLDALWSLVSYRDAAWLWERDGKPGEYRYRLVRPLAARDLAGRLRQAAQEEFEQEAEIMVSAVNMTPSQRKKLAQTHKELSVSLLSDDIIAGLRLFAEALPLERRLRVLRGQESPKIPFDQLSGPSLAFAKSHREKPGTLQVVGGGTVAILPGDWVQFVRKLNPGAIYPSLFLFIGTTGGFNYLGPQQMEEKFEARIAALWNLPGDKTLSAIEQRKMPPADKPDPLALFAPTREVIQARKLLGPEEGMRLQNLGMHSLEIRLKQLAQAAPLSLLAVLPIQPLQSYYVAPPYNQTVESMLKRLQEQPPHLLHKWRGEMLLLTHPAWTLDDQTLYPYNLVKQLRQDADRNDGYLSLETLATAADTLSDAQLKHLADEFPVMNSVVSLRKLFLLERRYPQIASTGVPLNEEIASVLRSVRSVPIEKDLQSGRVSTVRLVELRNKSRVRPGRQIQFQLLTNAGAVLSYFDFSDRGRAAN